MTSVHDGDHGDDGENEDYLDGGIKPLAATDPARIGPYLLLGRLGAGGMGRVYLARSEGGRTVAVKVVHAEHVADPQFRARFRREVDAARRVGERYTAPVLDAAPDEEFPWVATGYVPGLSLEQIVRGHGALPAESVLALADGLLRALRDIHSAGIVHRDLKPSNVMVTVEGPKVIDFGIARAAETSVEALTSTGMVIGSPGFMAPEQIRGENAVPKSDVFTLGCVLTYAATGRLPFGNGVSNQHAVMYHIVEAEPDLEGIRHEGLRALITRLLTKSAAERPSVDDLLAERDSAPAGASWLPAGVVSHLARQSARLLDAEAAPVRQEPADRGTVPLRPAAAQPPAIVPAGEVTPPKGQREARRRRRLLVSVPLVFVLAGGGGTVMVLQPFSGGSDSGAHASPPSASATAHPTTPPPSTAGSPSPNGDKSPQEAGDPGGEGADDGKDGKDGSNGRDAAVTGGSPGDGGTSAGGGGTTGGGSTDGGTSTGGSTGTSGSTTASGGGGSTGTSGSTSGSGGSGGSSGGSQVPSSFVGTWKYGEPYNVGEPGTITISSTGTVRLSDRPYATCPYVAQVVSKADGGSRINVSAAKLTGANAGYCHPSLDASYFTLNGSGIQHNVGPAAGDGYFYKRG